MSHVKSLQDAMSKCSGLWTKDAKTVEIGIQRRISATFERALAPVVDALKDCESKEPQVADRASEEEVEAYTDAVAGFRQFADAAVERFDGMIAKDKELHPDVKTNVRKGLKILKTQVMAIAATNETNVKAIESARKNLNAFETLVANFEKSLKSTLLRALAAAARIKANPTAKAWNAEFPKAARDVTQNIGNVGRLRAKGIDVPGPDPKQYFDILKNFADKPYDNLPQDVTETEVLDLLKKFTTTIKAVQQAYAGII